jgi:biopolymer transport protein ExbD
MYSMLTMSARLLLATTTFAMGAAWAEPPPDVTVHVSAKQTCLVGSIDLPCHDVGAKLRDQGTSLDANIHLIGDRHTGYRAVSAAVKSLRDAGFRLKVGYVIVGNDRAK